MSGLLLFPYFEASAGATTSASSPRGARRTAVERIRLAAPTRMNTPLEPPIVHFAPAVALRTVAKPLRPNNSTFVSAFVGPGAIFLQLVIGEDRALQRIFV